MKQYLKPTSIPSQNLPQLADDEFMKVNRTRSRKKKPEEKYIDSDYTTDDTSDDTTDDSDCERVTVKKKAKIIPNDLLQNTEHVIECVEYEVPLPHVEPEKEQKKLSLVEMTEIEFIDIMDAEVGESRSTRSELENIYPCFIRTEQELCICTGLNSFEILDNIVERFVSSSKHFVNIYLTDADCVVMALIKLKQNVTIELLSVIFRYSRVRVLSFIIRQTFKVLSDCLSRDVYWLDRTDIRMTLPSCFQNQLSSVRAILYGIGIEISSTQSDDTSVINKCKFLIALAPSGIVSYVSPGYYGEITEKDIFNAQQLHLKFDCEIDSIMFEKEFDADPEFDAENKIKVISDYIPKKVDLDSDEDSELEMVKCDYISRARKHNDYVVDQIKLFEILKQKLDPYLLTEIDHLLVVICAISNLNLREVKTEMFTQNM